jgi:hypothetical protein
MCGMHTNSCIKMIAADQIVARTEMKGNLSHSWKIVVCYTGGKIMTKLLVHIGRHFDERVKSIRRLVLVMHSCIHFCRVCATFQVIRSPANGRRIGRRHEGE